MNKTELGAAVAERLGTGRTGGNRALDAVLETIQEEVAAGHRVSITGFGVFEPAERAARTAKNPRTGEAIEVAASTVPKFRPGQAFRDAVAGGAS